MTGETRIALLLGMVFIFAFGLVLGEIAGPTAIEPAPAMKLRDVDYLARPTQGQQARRPVQLAPEGVPGIVYRDPAGRTNGRDLAAGQQTSHQQQGRSRRPRQVSVVHQAVRNAPAVATYRVQPDDTLIGIARKAYGADNGHLWMRIHEANRDSIPDPGAIPVGTILRIPPLSTDVAERSQVAATENRSAPPGRARRPERTATVGIDGLREWLGVGSGRESSSPAPTTAHHDPERSRGWGRVYVTRSGDNLTSIARRQMGDDSPQAVDRLFQANQDSLDSPHVVPVGVTLRIPS